MLPGVSLSRPGLASLCPAPPQEQPRPGAGGKKDILGLPREQAGAGGCVGADPTRQSCWEGISGAGLQHGGVEWQKVENLLQFGKFLAFFWVVSGASVGASDQSVAPVRSQIVASLL